MVDNLLVGAFGVCALQRGIWSLTASFTTSSTRSPSASFSMYFTLRLTCCVSNSTVSELSVSVSHLLRFAVTSLRPPNQLGAGEMHFQTVEPAGCHAAHTFVMTCKPPTAALRLLLLLQSLRPVGGTLSELKREDPNSGGVMKLDWDCEPDVVDSNFSHVQTKRNCFQMHVTTTCWLLHLQ